MSEETDLVETRKPGTTIPDTAGASHESLSYPALLGSHVFELDCWLVYPTRNLIQHRSDAGDSRQLEPRLMRLLCLLAASADAVVAREDMINVLWPRVVVNENSLTRAVSDLRRTLTPAGEKRSALIQTIPKRGYRLTQAPALVTLPAHPLAIASPGSGKTSAGHWIKRWTPAIAASFMLALALAVSISDDGQRDLLVAQLPTTMQTPSVTPDRDRRQPGSLYDRVLGSATAQEADTLPASLARDDEISFPITRLGGAPAWQGNPATLPALIKPGTSENAEVIERQGQSMLTPDGQLLAYVNYRDGIASLNLRPIMADAEPWVAFTTDERIFHLQWSPLDAGILLTVGQTEDNPDRASYLRLMLLDLETLTVQELYRRELPEEQAWTQNIGNLT